MKIREITIDDYDELYALWCRTPGMGITESDSREELARFLERNPGLSLAAVDEADLPVGSVLVGHDGRRGFLYHLAVDPGYRKSGLGSTLTAAALQKLESEGIRKCHIFVLADNELGQKFWSGTGWSKRNDFYVFSKSTG